MINVEVPTNLLIIISVIIFLLIVVCILYIIYKDRKKDDEEIDEILEDLVKAKPREEKNSKVEKEQLINAKIEVPIGEIKEDKEELKEDKIDLEDMLNKMQKSLDSKEEVVENFEIEQEEKAIISYQELLENMKKDDFQQDIEIHEQEEEKTASEINKEKVIEFLKREEPKMSKIESTTENIKKFKNTDFISPIFGKQDAKIEYPTIKSFKVPKHAKEDNDILDEIDIPVMNKVIENKTIDIPVTEEKNTEFLNALKEFRNNL